MANPFSKEHMLEAALRDVTDRLESELELSHCFGEDGVEPCRNIKCRSLDPEDHDDCTDELCVYCAGWESLNTVGVLLEAIEKMPPTPTADSFPLGYVAPPDSAYCSHCGAGPADDAGELPHYRDCQEA